MRVIVFYTYLCIFALGMSVNADVQHFNEDKMPIKWVQYSHGKGNEVRIERLLAEILPKHVTTNERVDFPKSGPIEKHFKAVKEAGDERGHLVASQFSGPPQWYNLSPQNERVNRNKGFNCITTDWYGSECEVRKHLSKGGNVKVNWMVDMTYIGNSCRPNEYHLRVDFFQNGKNINKSIDAHIKNPTLKQDSTFWVCRVCRSNTHENGCTKQ